MIIIMIIILDPFTYGFEVMQVAELQLQIAQLQLRAKTLEVLQLQHEKRVLHYTAEELQDTVRVLRAQFQRQRPLSTSTTAGSYCRSTLSYLMPSV
jgi:predicted transcriptional regulator